MTLDAREVDQVKQLIAVALEGAQDDIYERLRKLEGIRFAIVFDASNIYEEFKRRQEAEG